MTDDHNQPTETGYKPVIIGAAGRSNVLNALVNFTNQLRETHIPQLCIAACATGPSGVPHLTEAIRTIEAATEQLDRAIEAEHDALHEQWPELFGPTLGEQLLNILTDPPFEADGPSPEEGRDG